jgi:hypothetical protein
MLVNLTPHTITIDVNGTSVRIPQGGRPARCKMAHTAAEALEFDGHRIPLVDNRATEVTHLPEPVERTFYIVSRMVAAAMKGLRDDLLVVHNLVIDDTRHVRGCRALMRVS